MRRRAHGSPRVEVLAWFSSNSISGSGLQPHDLLAGLGRTGPAQAVGRRWSCGSDWAMTASATGARIRASAAGSKEGGGSVIGESPVGTLSGSACASTAPSPPEHLRNCRSFDLRPAHLASEEAEAACAANDGSPGTQSAPKVDLNKQLLYNVLNLYKAQEVVLIYTQS